MSCATRLVPPREADEQGARNVQGSDEIDASQVMEEARESGHGKQGKSEDKGCRLSPEPYDTLSEQSDELSFALSTRSGRDQEAGKRGGGGGHTTSPWQGAEFRDTLGAESKCREFPSRAFSAQSRLTKGVRVCDTCMAVYARIHLRLLEPGPPADGSKELKETDAKRAEHAVCEAQQPDSAAPADHDNPFYEDHYPCSRPESGASVRPWSPHVVQARRERFQPDPGPSTQKQFASASGLDGQVAAGATGGASRGNGSKCVRATKYMLQAKPDAVVAARGASTHSWRPAGVFAPASGDPVIRPGLRVLGYLC